MRIPRILLAAPSSGSGKTVLACALMKALEMRGKKVAAYKCGPDYIDPMFHREVLGIDSENLDLFFDSPLFSLAAAAQKDGTPGTNSVG